MRGQKTLQNNSIVRLLLIPISIGVLHTIAIVLFVLGLEPSGGLGTTYIDPHLQEWWVWCVCGLVVLGAVPTALWLNFNLITPIITIALLLSIATIGEATQPIPVAGSPWGPIGPYISAWPAPLTVALFVGCIEWAFRQETVPENS